MAFDMYSKIDREISKEVRTWSVKFYRGLLSQYGFPVNVDQLEVKDGHGYQGVIMIRNV